MCLVRLLAKIEGIANTCCFMIIGDLHILRDDLKSSGVLHFTTSTRFIIENVSHCYKYRVQTTKCNTDANGNSKATHSNKEKALTQATNSTRVLLTAGGQDGKCLVILLCLCEE